jgi:tripartite-type tricarboxylate transporter receptor subunit TctC
MDRGLALRTCLVLASALSLSPTFAEQTDFYRGKILTILVGSTAGGEFDAYARLLAQHLADHIPGKPSILVENMPGAGTLTALRALEVTRPVDGTVIATFNPGLITQSVIEPQSINADFHKLAWIGVATPDFRVCYGFGAKGVNSWGDLMQRKTFIIGSTAKGSGNYINGATLRILFHAPVKQVLGFPGAAQQRLAIEQGELDGDCGSFSAIPENWIRNGQAHMFVRFSPQRADGISAGATFIDDLAKTAEERQVLDVLDAGNEVGRPFVISRQVPSDHITIIRDAFNATMRDPAFLSEAKHDRRPIYPLTGTQAEIIVDRMMDASPVVISAAKEIYN